MSKKQLHIESLHAKLMLKYGGSWILMVGFMQKLHYFSYEVFLFFLVDVYKFIYVYICNTGARKSLIRLIYIYT